MALVGIVGVDLACVPHGSSERQRLAAAPAQRSRPASRDGHPPAAPRSGCPRPGPRTSPCRGRPPPRREGYWRADWAGIGRQRGDQGVATAPRGASAFNTLSRVAFNVLTRRSTRARSASAYLLRRGGRQRARVNEGISHSGIFASAWRRCPPCGSVRRSRPPSVGPQRMLGFLSRPGWTRPPSVRRHAGAAASAEDRGSGRAHLRGERLAPAQHVVDQRADSGTIAGGQQSDAPCRRVGQRRRRPDGGARGCLAGISEAALMLAPSRMKVAPSLSTQSRDQTLPG